MKAKCSICGKNRVVHKRKKYENKLICYTCYVKERDRK